MKKLLAFFLSLIFTLTAFAGCNKSGETEEASTAQTTAEATAAEQTTEPAPEVILPPAEDEEKNLTVVADGKSEFVIVYPKFDNTCKAQAEQIQGWIESAYGVKITVSDDIAAADSADVCEILVGKTNRSASTQIYERLGRKQDYACCVVGKKIVLVGFDSTVGQKAVNSFYASYLSNVKDAAKPMLVPASLDRVVEGHYMVNVGVCEGKPLSKFNIVYPKESTNGELYVAQMLRAHLYQKGEMNLPIKSDSILASAKEIRIGAVKRTEAERVGKDEFVVSVINGNIHVLANDFFGYVAAEEYLVGTLFGPNMHKDTLQNGFRYVGKVTEKAPERTGEIRLMFQNVWGYGKDEGTRLIHAATALSAYAADALGLNEYTGMLRRNGSIARLLEKNGYQEVQIDGVTDNGVPIFYRSDRLTLIDAAYAQPLEYEGATIALFEVNHTSKRFVMVCTHLSANRDDTAEGYEWGSERRLRNVAHLMETLTPFLQKHGDIPVYMGGDYNNRYNMEACALLKEYGFVNTRDVSEVVADNHGSCNGYPLWDDKLGFYANPQTGSSTYPSAIDQIFRMGSGVKEKYFAIIAGDEYAIYSDHCPIMIEFSFES